MFSIYERLLYVDGGTWTSTLPPDPHPGMVALFGELDAGTLEMWEGIDGVYRIYEPGRGHRLLVELPQHGDPEWLPDAPHPMQGTQSRGDESQETNER